MKRSVVALVLLFLVGASVTGFAAGTTDLITGQFDATSKEERLEIAREIFDLVEKLSNYVTAPKPSEIDWVLAEQEAISGLKGTDAWYERSNQLYQSAEFQNLKLRSLLDNIKRSLLCVTGEDPSIEDTSISQEILCWSLADRDLSTRSTIDDAISILIKHDRLPIDIAEKAELREGDYSAYYDWWAHGINEYIVIPYLQGKITE